MSRLRVSVWYFAATVAKRIRRRVSNPTIAGSNPAGGSKEGAP